MPRKQLVGGKDVQTEQWTTAANSYGGRLAASFKPDRQEKSRALAEQMSDASAAPSRDNYVWSGALNGFLVDGSTTEVARGLMAVEARERAAQNPNPLPPAAALKLRKVRRCRLTLSNSL